MGRRAGLTARDIEPILPKLRATILPTRRESTITFCCLRTKLGVIRRGVAKRGTNVGIIAHSPLVPIVVAIVVTNVVAFAARLGRANRVDNSVGIRVGSRADTSLVSRASAKPARAWGRET